MLKADTVDRIRNLEGGEYPVLSVYLALRPGFGELRAIPARLKDLLAPAKAQAEEMPRDAAMSLRKDIDAVLAMTDRIAGDLGRSVAIFKASAAGIDEYLSLPAPVRDRAIVDRRPYVAPLDAALEYFHEFCAVVVDRRKSSIFRFSMGELESWEEMAEEEIRKANFGGFAGYEEHRVRNRTDEIALRHYRETAARLVQLATDPGYDLLLVGGPQQHIDGLLAELSPDLAGRVAGTFTIDPGTMTPALVRDACMDLAEDYDRRRQEELVESVLDLAASGGLAVVGVPYVVAAANQRAVDLLLVQAGPMRPGTVCIDCGWITVEPEALCPACGEPTRVVPDVVDAVCGAVRSAGGKVEHILVKTPLVDDEVAATLRFGPVPEI